jgi:D-threo-aldose 1-dehydrogenase
MRTRTLRSLSLTELGLGGSAIGNLFHTVADDEARRTVDAAWAAGIRYFDTAPHYGLGLSESRLGQALRERRRDQYVLSTKVGRRLEPNPAPTGSDLAAGGFAVPDTYRRRFDFSRDGVNRSLASSLARLGTDRIDIVYVHDPDDHLDEAMATAVPALIDLRDQGVIGAVGVGMNQWQAPLRLVRESDLDVVMLAGRWTLADRSGGPLLAECARRGVRVVAAAPFNSGLLARDVPMPDATFDHGPASSDIRARAAGLAETCRRRGVSLPAAALQFPLRAAVVSAVVCGLRSAGEVETARTGIAADIPAAAWTELDG